ncbi:hypothetical protein G7Z17_g12738 [Cylindrodendrum hubeiense]|uniref:Uncharacterized protein n=1 Tax=Cylindrodendrum hubeiense TaxID=595255 RepID=A0A9P5LAA7_9HYPO|nr:hypothetical protein G7Z17_g12738 [Cylindrodendrum hubeiense]
MASDTEPDFQEYDVPKDKLSRPQRHQPEVDERWRPGRSSENVEFNLALQRNQRLRAQESTIEGLGSLQPESVNSPSPQEPNEYLRFPWMRPLDEGDKSSAWRRTRRPIPPDWKPPLAVGASLGEGLSRLEEADRLVAQWEAILRNARETQPYADLSPFARQLEKVTRERDGMVECEENMVPVEDLESTKRERIEGRIGILEKARDRCGSQASKVNIQAAIDAYKDGRILCWDKWTLVYAGHIVDHCPTYESFTVDRSERLDRYFQEYGEGWLWFEAPLAPKGNAQPGHLLGATWAAPSGHKGKFWSGAANGWNITMGFRRVRSFHSRLIQSGGSRPDLGQSEGNLAETRSPQGRILPFTPMHTGLSKKQMKGLQWTVNDDPDGPRCFFLMHLDSGASIPSLHETDLAMLGIDMQTYSAQTEMPMATANGIVDMPLFELRVDGDSGALTADILEERRQRGEDVSEKALAERGKRFAETRLSGMLPFQVCYLACAPGMTPWFGEDRRDVLGADRMPGQRRYEWHKGILSQEAPVDVEITERPRLIVFEHELGSEQKLRDVDVLGRPGASITTLIDGSDVESFLVEPRRL